MSLSFVQPLDETQRLEALQPYLLLNTMPDSTFSELIRLTAKLFNVPVAIIALVEENDVRFDINVGLDGLDRVPREETLCSVALLKGEVTVFENLHENPCDLINMTLVRELQLGFYAGQTLRTAAGQPIGVLCVIDYAARSFQAEEQALLAEMAAVVMELLDVRLKMLLTPDWNPTLWVNIYRRITESITRLETLGSLAQWEDTPDTAAAQSYRRSAQDELLRVVNVLHEQIARS